MISIPPAMSTPITAVRDLFEIPDGITYLNCASMAPQLRGVTEAGLRAVRTKASPWNLSGPEWFSGSEELRALAARVMGTDSDAVALVPRVSAFRRSCALLPRESGALTAMRLLGSGLPAMESRLLRRTCRSRAD